MLSKVLQTTCGRRESNPHIYMLQSHEQTSWHVYHKAKDTNNAYG